MVWPFRCWKFCNSKRVRCVINLSGFMFCNENKYFLVQFVSECVRSICQAHFCWWSAHFHPKQAEIERQRAREGEQREGVEMANENSPRYQKQNDKMHLRKQNHPIRCRRTVGHAKSERNRRHKIAFIFIDSILMCAKRDSSVRDRVSTQCDVFFYASMCALRIDTEKIRSERQARSLCIHFFMMFAHMWWCFKVKVNVYRGEENVQIVSNWNEAPWVFVFGMANVHIQSDSRSKAKYSNTIRSLPLSPLFFFFSF